MSAAAWNDDTPMKNLLCGVDAIASTDSAVLSALNQSARVFDA